MATALDESTSAGAAQSTLQFESPAGADRAAVDNVCATLRRLRDGLARETRPLSAPDDNLPAHADLFSSDRQTVQQILESLRSDQHASAARREKLQSISLPPLIELRLAPLTPPAEQEIAPAVAAEPTDVVAATPGTVVAPAEPALEVLSGDDIPQAACAAERLLPGDKPPATPEPRYHPPDARSTPSAPPQNRAIAQRKKPAQKSGSQPELRVRPCPTPEQSAAGSPAGPAKGVSAKGKPSGTTRGKDGDKSAASLRQRPCPAPWQAPVELDALRQGSSTAAGRRVRSTPPPAMPDRRSALWLKLGVINLSAALTAILYRNYGLTEGPSSALAWGAAAIGMIALVSLVTQTTWPFGTKRS